MKTEHTPGPWHVCVPDHRGFAVAPGEDMCEAGNPYIMSDWGHRGKNGVDLRCLHMGEAAANARLIAAAPELLAACEYLMGAMTPKQLHGKPGAGEPAGITMARAAIAKARP